MKRTGSLKGLQGVRTLHSAKKRSIPRIQSSTYLDLYMMDKEKERLLQENEKLGMRTNTINKRLRDINREMNELKETDSAKTSANSNSSKHVVSKAEKKEWKKMSLNY